MSCSPQPATAIGLGFEVILNIAWGIEALLFTTRLTNSSVVCTSCASRVSRKCAAVSSIGAACVAAIQRFLEQIG